MTKLEKLYQTINNFKELGFKLSEDVIDETNRVEEEIIQKEVIPALAKAIDPIIAQIQRELVLVVEYIPDEPLTVKMTRKRSFKLSEEDDRVVTERKGFKKEKSYTIAPHTKSKKKNMVVTFPDGTVLENQFAYQTFCQAIEKIDPEKAAALELRQSGINIVSKVKDEFYNQHEVKGGWFILTHSSTALKKEHLETIAKALHIKLKVKLT